MTTIQINHTEIPFLILGFTEAVSHSMYAGGRVAYMERLSILAYNVTILLDDIIDPELVDDLYGEWLQYRLAAAVIKKMPRTELARSSEWKFHNKHMDRKTLRLIVAGLKPNWLRKK